MKIAIVMSLLLAAYAAPAQNYFKGRFTLTVDIRQMENRPKKVILQYKRLIDGQLTSIHDTVKVSGSQVIFSGVIDEPTPAMIYGLQVTPLFSGADFFIEPGDSKLITKKKFPGSTIESGAFQQSIDTLYAAMKSYNDLHPLVLSDSEKAVTSGNEQAYMRLDAKRERWNNAMMEAVYKPFIVRHARSSFAAVYALNKYAGEADLLIRPAALSTTDSLFHLLSAPLQALPTVIALKARIDKAKEVAIGQMAPDFTQPDTSGRMISLSSFRGRYVLVDLWASWCHWCRAESPNIIAAYKKYHDYGFDVLQVSLDTKFYEAAWHKAIRTDYTGIWDQVCELSDTNSIAALYGVQAIPQNFLIDPAGKIVAVNLRVDALEEKLSEIFSSRQLDHVQGAPLQQEPYRVTIDISRLEPKPETLYLMYDKKDKGQQGFQQDSVKITGNTVQFDGVLPEPVAASLSSRPYSTALRFYLQPGTSAITAGPGLDQSLVSGGKLQQDFDSLQILERAYMQNTGNMPDSLQHTAVRDRNALNYFGPFLTAHSGSSPVSVLALQDYMQNSDPDSSYDTADSLFNLLAPAFRQTPSAITLKNKIDAAKNTAIGNIAPDFEQPDTAGRIVTLSSFRGKYVLVDFWASWCHPCRGENPNLVKAFKKYHSKGLEMLSISLDNKSGRNKWIAAMRQDHINNWTNVSDLKAFESPVVVKYNIQAIPRNFLINPQGKIIARDLRGGAVEEKLKEIFAADFAAN